MRTYQAHAEETAIDKPRVDVFAGRVELWLDGDMIAQLTPIEARDLGEALIDGAKGGGRQNDDD